MVTILMMSAKLATPYSLKRKIFPNISKNLLTMTSPTEFYYVAQIILLMWSCDQSLVTQASL